ncbi:ubiquitin-like protein Pup [Nigerium massiliense]|uniref:ubiquitin-like protein Pup n=1 Tax=Nigerium massiliense TaxID=1522317 RepID=UPI00058F2D4F|nr:ubiquitin-like protein Pup [Nigerium massiliense]
MSERIQRRRSTRPQQDEAPATQTARRDQSVDYDALLDEIDGVLESTSEDYVRNFVQKGGQ